MNHTTKRTAEKRRILPELLRQPGAARALGEVRSGLAGLVLSAAATGALPLPVYLGYLLNLDGDSGALAAALGSAAGAALFWRGQNLVTLLAGLVTGLLALGILSGTGLRKHPWFAPVLGTSAVGAIGLVFLLTNHGAATGDLRGLLVQCGAAALSGLLFRPRSGEASAPLRAFQAGLFCLSLCQVLVFRVLDLGLAAAALCLALWEDLPTAVLCGLGIDLARITPVPVTPILCLELLVLKLGDGAFRRRAALVTPLMSLPVMFAVGTVDPVVPTGLLAGSLASLVRRRTVPLPAPAPVRAAPGTWERLTLAAGALEHAADLLRTPPPEQPVLLPEKLQQLVCTDCPCWEQCQGAGAESPFGALAAWLETLPMETQVEPNQLPPVFRAQCCRTEELVRTLQLALRDARVRRQYTHRQAEALRAVHRQYDALARYLRRTAGEAACPAPVQPLRYRVELGIAARSRYGAETSGDCGVHFRGPGAVYYVVLCDGMGAGSGAAQEGESALRLLEGMLRAGLPPDTALEALNDLFVLRSTGGFASAEVLELRLDTGRARFYKWGAPPSCLKLRRTVRRIGRAIPPPGLRNGADTGPEICGLTLHPGEYLVMLTDGLSGPEIRERIASLPESSPKDLACALLPPGFVPEDDCTAVVIALAPGATTE